MREDGFVQVWLFDRRQGRQVLGGAYFALNVIGYGDIDCLVRPILVELALRSGRNWVNPGTK